MTTLIQGLGSARSADPSPSVNVTPALSRGREKVDGGINRTAVIWRYPLASYAPPLVDKSMLSQCEFRVKRSLPWYR